VSNGRTGFSLVAILNSELTVGVRTHRRLLGGLPAMGTGRRMRLVANRSVKLSLTLPTPLRVYPLTVWRDRSGTLGVSEY
jgi:hypothetical protein